MVNFEQFLLAELKDIFNYIKIKYELLPKYKIYQLNKYDLIVILRNSNYFDETIETHLLFNLEGVNSIKFTPQTGKRYYKGEKLYAGVEFRLGTYTLNFN
tara:strand:+ start:2161 stop:2460 length:300 start_codon:yes stop_codon:yes gene_type:complete